jgi:hypothetical protein
LDSIEPIDDKAVLLSLLYRPFDDTQRRYLHFDYGNEPVVELRTITERSGAENSMRQTFYPVEPTLAEELRIHHLVDGEVHFGYIDHQTFHLNVNGRGVWHEEHVRIKTLWSRFAIIRFLNRPYSGALEEEPRVAVCRIPGNDHEGRIGFRVDLYEQGRDLGQTQMGFFFPKQELFLEQSFQDYYDLTAEFDR